MWPSVANSNDLLGTIKTAKVLAVGAGGIGCELLKTLVLTGFEDIEIIDMDTIETSNLNRQFLFRKRHVGHSKAKVAAEAVKKFRPNARIVPHQANVKEPQYGVDFFRQFAIVLNGLDNLEARRHVNRLCLAAETPLVESGTAGYLGQVTVHMKDRTECFECEPKPAPKSFPVCTIRNTPDKLIHCVVWAKELLFQRLFGSPDAVTDLDEAAAAEGDGAGGSSGAAASSSADDASAFAPRDSEPVCQYALRIFDRVYGSDIQRVLGMEELWKSRARPTPLFSEAVLRGDGGDAAQNGTAGKQKSKCSCAHCPFQSAGPSSGGTQPSAARYLGLTNSHKAWTLRENALIFLHCIRLFIQERPQDIGSAVFDKDDDLAVEFVAAAANLRAAVYGIPQQNLFEAKGMAGNIIHAIATTNAAIAGLIVIEALKILSGTSDRCKNVFLRQADKKLVMPVGTSKPNPACMVCGHSQLQLRLNTETTLFSTFVAKVLKGRMALVAPTVMCGGLMYEEGEDLDEEDIERCQALLKKTLAGLPGGGIGNGAIVDVSDQAQHLSLKIVVSHQADLSEEEVPEGFALRGEIPTAAATKGPAPEGAAAGTAAAAADSDDDVVFVRDPSAPKRKREEPLSEVAAGKRPKVAVEEDDVIMLD